MHCFEIKILLDPDDHWAYVKVCIENNKHYHLFIFVLLFFLWELCLNDYLAGEIYSQNCFIALAHSNHTHWRTWILMYFLGCSLMYRWFQIRCQDYPKSYSHQMKLAFKLDPKFWRNSCDHIQREGITQWCSLCGWIKCLDLQCRSSSGSY